MLVGKIKYHPYPAGKAERNSQNQLEIDFSLPEIMKWKYDFGDGECSKNGEIGKFLLKTFLKKNLKIFSGIESKKLKPMACVS